MVSNCGSDEKGGITGGMAGDQTGGEYRIINWYRYRGGWNCVLRHPDPKVRAEIARLATAAANNDKIGYDQLERLTFWNMLAASGYDPAKITTPCEADCSSSTCAIVKAVGYRLNIAALKNVPNYLTTWGIQDAFVSAGFTVLTDSKYLESDSYLYEGDILLRTDSHVAINVTTGYLAPSVSVPSKPDENIHEGSSGQQDLPDIDDGNIKVGDIVKIEPGAKYTNGYSVPSWVTNQNWIVEETSGTGVLINFNEQRTSNIMSRIDAKYLSVVNSSEKEPEIPVEAQKTDVDSGESNESGKVYIVKQGDSLWNIALKELGNPLLFMKIKKINNLVSDWIFPGQELKLP